MIYLQAVAREANSVAACLRLSENRLIELFISRQIIAEVQGVLSRDSIRLLKIMTPENFLDEVEQSEASK